MVSEQEKPRLTRSPNKSFSYHGSERGSFTLRLFKVQSNGLTEQAQPDCHRLGASQSRHCNRRRRRRRSPSSHSSSRTPAEDGCCSRLKSLPDAEPHRLRGRRNGGSHPRIRQLRLARLRHDQRERFPSRPRFGRVFRKGSTPRVLSTRTLGLPVQPRPGRTDQLSSLRWNDRQKNPLRNRQDRLPSPPHPLPDFAQVRKYPSIRRVVRNLPTG